MKLLNNSPLWHSTKIDIAESMIFYLLILAIFAICCSKTSLSPEILQAFSYIQLSLTILLCCDQIFYHDLQNGTIDIHLMQNTESIFGHKLPLLYVYRKICLFLLFQIAPILLCYGLICIWQNNSLLYSIYCLITASIYSIGFSFLSSLAAALKIGSKKNNLLRFLLIIPLSTPMLLFAITALRSYPYNSYLTQSASSFSFLIAIASFFAIISPIFCSLLLKSLND